ncbi:uncharacterized protein LOC117596787 [Pangasianodon hypophthalmus]|uniref:uncharacterized protein LOC117596787 n=1 Tax=Pangasianodon hypophthalmus TaxID=310915 RepID=UPI002307FE15|nr:uncharacterized protein LOC117596787 [Pangasianodon hypophthalmus]
MIPLTNRFTVLETLETDGVEQTLHTDQHLHNSKPREFLDRHLRKLYFKFLQATHHEDIVTTALHTQIFPKGMSKQTHKLTQFIKPACPKQQTLHRITENTQNWMKANMQILKDHYVQVKAELLNRIHKMEETEWQIAVKWAKGRFKHKLREDIIERAKTQMEQNLVETENGGTACLPIQVSNSSSNPSSTAASSFSSSLSSSISSSSSSKQSPSKDDTNLVASSPQMHLSKSNGTPRPLNNNSDKTKGEPTQGDRKQERKEVMNGSTERKTTSLRKARSESSLSLSPSSFSLTPLHVEHPDRVEPQIKTCEVRNHWVPTRHPNTTRKIADWTLEVKKPVLFIGDSNLSRIPYFSDENVQVDSYPGANFLHIAKVLQKLTPNPNTQKVVLSLGINNREQTFESPQEDLLSKGLTFIPTPCGSRNRYGEEICSSLREHLYV